MSNFTEAADAIRRIAKTLEGFKIAADALESIGSVDNAAKEAEAACDTAKREHARVLAQIDEAKAALVDVRTEAAQVTRDANEQAEATLADARIKGENLVTDMAESAAVSTGKMTEVAMTARDKMLAEEKDAASALAVAKAKSKVLDEAIAVKQTQLDALNESLDALKAKLA